MGFVSQGQRLIGTVTFMHTDTVALESSRQQEASSFVASESGPCER